MNAFALQRRLAGLLTAVILTLVLDVTAATANLTGIALLHSGKRALLEIKTDRGDIIRPTLSVRERVENIEVTFIDERTGQVTVKNGGKEEVLSLGVDEGPAGRTFNFKDASFIRVLDLFQEIQGVTVIRAPSVPDFKLTLKSDGALSRSEAAAMLEKAFTDQGLFITLRSSRFAVVTALNQKAHAEHLPEPPKPPEPVAAPVSTPVPSAVEGTEIFPPGLIRFQETDDRQVLEIYSELSGRMVLRSPQTRNTKVSLRSQTQLNRAEAQWLLESALSLGGIALVPEGQKFVFALPVTRLVNAPKVPANPLAAAVKDGPFPPGTLMFDRASGSQMLAIYAELIGRQPVNTGVPSVSISLRSQIPLTRAEALYALDATAALNHLRFVGAGDQQVTLEAAPTDRKDAATPPK